MQIVNQTVRGAEELGYADETAEAIIEYIAEHGHVIDAPGLKPSTMRCSTPPWGSGQSSRWVTYG